MKFVLHHPCSKIEVFSLPNTNLTFNINVLVLSRKTKKKNNQEQKSCTAKAR